MSKKQSPKPLPPRLAGASRRELGAIIKWAAGEMARQRRNPSGGITRWGGRPPGDHDWDDPTCDCSFCARKKIRENGLTAVSITKQAY